MLRAERAIKVAFDHMVWLNSRVSFPMVINMGLEDERFQNQGMLAIKYDGWEINSEEEEIEIDSFENAVKGSP